MDRALETRIETHETALKMPHQSSVQRPFSSDDIAEYISSRLDRVYFEIFMPRCAYRSELHLAILRVMKGLVASTPSRLRAITTRLIIEPNIIISHL